jgi:hypothetical protein
MFVRFRQSRQRLQLSLVSTLRVAGKVRHEHIASLGSVVAPPLLTARVEFWRALHERLARLANRVDAATQAKILDSVHNRIPMPTSEEQRAAQREAAEHDIRFWSGMQDMHGSTIADHKELVAKAEKIISSSTGEQAKAAEQAEHARQKLARIDAGEDVQGGLKPVNIEAALRAAGWTKADMRRALLLAELYDAGAEEECSQEVLKRHDRARNAAIRATARRHRLLP